MKVSVVICTFNSWVLAAKCVTEVLRLEPQIEIVLVDDGSDDPAPDDGLPEGVTLVRQAETQGFAAALNRGFRSSASDCVVVFDADAFPLAPFRSRLESRLLASPGLGVLGFRSYDAEGRETPSLTKGPEALSFVVGQRLAALVAGWRPRRFADGAGLPTLAGLAIRRQVFEEVGGFDEEFRFLDVDIDFGLRARDAGWLVEQDEQMSVFHVGGGSSLNAGERLAFFYADRWRSLRKHGRLCFPDVARRVVRLRLVAEWLLLALAARLDSTRRAACLDAAAGRRLAWIALGPRSHVRGRGSKAG